MAGTAITYFFILYDFKASEKKMDDSCICART